MPPWISKLRPLPILWPLGCAIMALAAWLCFRAGLDFATTAFVFLIIIVALSLLDSLISSVVFSVAAIGILTYFFVEPLFSFQVNTAQDLTALTAFLITSFLVTGLVRRVRTSEEALRRSQAAHLAEAQRLSLTGSFGWDAASGDVFWSDQSFSIFDYQAGTKPTIELMMERVHPEDVAQVRRAFERGSSEGADFDIEYRLSMPGGALKHIHAVARAMPHEGGKRQFVGALMDVTAAKLAEERLQRTQAELAYIARVITLGALTASIAHEVNQPLAAIVNKGEACLRWLARGTQLPGKVTETVNSMIGDGKRASEIVQRIRSLTMKTELEKAGLDLNEVIDEVIPLVRSEVAGHRVALQLALAPALPRVLGDRVQLQQVLINLMLNGVQAMATVNDRPRRLVIRSERTAPDQVRVAVQDSGVGIKPEDAERVFDAFFTTKPEGMGMGLSICRSIIEAHGGQLSVAPNSSGAGAVFTFSLPTACACSKSPQG